GPPRACAAALRARRVRGAWRAVGSARRIRCARVTHRPDAGAGQGAPRLALLSNGRLHLAQEEAMEATFMAALAGVTSIRAYYVGAPGLGLPSARPGAARGEMLETVGMVASFLALNPTAAPPILLVAPRPTGTV